MQDYHVHSNFSFDAEASLRDMCEAALENGLSGLCFTDHVDLDMDPPMFPLSDIAARNRALEALIPEFPTLAIRKGAEIALGEAGSIQRALAHMGEEKPDFLIASLHVLDGIDIYYPEYYENRSREEGYRYYIEKLAEYLPLSEGRFSVLGHYDFCAKYAPFEERTFRLSHAGEAMDFVLSYLVKEGKSLEVNTSSWKAATPWGLDVLKRFRELGGEYVTIGSDAHKKENLAQRFTEAAELVKAAGIRYYASFKAMEPTLHLL